LKTPVVMATQHPDSASRYVPVQKEVDEAIEGFTAWRREGLNFDEYKVDYEGKMTPYHQLAQIVTRLVEEGLEPGYDVFVTPRLPNAREETVFRQLMAIMAAIEANYYVQDRLDHPAIVELINPMTRDVDDILAVEKRIRYLADLAGESLNAKHIAGEIAVIPLLEQVRTLVNAEAMLKEYINRTGRRRIRVFLGKSDPALTSGLIAATLSVKIAIDATRRIEESLEVRIDPIIGIGSLPFRGHLTPDNVDNVIQEYRGCRTVTVQSALRYDYPVDHVKRVIARLKNRLPKEEPVEIPDRDLGILKTIISKSEVKYREEFSAIAKIIPQISRFMPRQRDRLLLNEPLKYGRRAGGYTMPRVITFTAALYSIGLPPEFIGLKATLESLSKDETQKLMEYYPSLIADLETAGRYLSLETASEFLDLQVIKTVKENVEAAHGLGVEISPDEKYHDLLTLLSSYLRILLKKYDASLLRDARKIICQLGVLRGGLG